MPHKTTVTFSDDLYLRLRLMAERERRSVSEVVDDLLRTALRPSSRRGAFRSHAAGEADVDDLGANAEKYLAEDLR